jgi:hypothetical protein
MHDSISTDGRTRPRVRRGLGVFVGVALLASPMVIAPAAPAAPLSNVTVQSISALLSQLPAFLVQILSSLAHTLSVPLGEQAPNSGACTPAAASGGISATLTCSAVGPLQGALSGPAKAKVKASVKNGRVTSVRWNNR